VFHGKNVLDEDSVKVAFENPVHRGRFRFQRYHSTAVQRQLASDFGDKSRGLVPFQNKLAKTQRLCRVNFLQLRCSNKQRVHALARGTGEADLTAVVRSHAPHRVEAVRGVRGRLCLNLKAGFDAVLHDDPECVFGIQTKGRRNQRAVDLVVHERNARRRHEPDWDRS